MPVQLPPNGHPIEGAAPPSHPRGCGANHFRVTDCDARAPPADLASFGGAGLISGGAGHPAAESGQQGVHPSRAQAPLPSPIGPGMPPLYSAA